MRKAWALVAAIALAVSGIQSSARASAFIPGDVVIYRVGDGTTSLANTGNPVFLDEYNPTTGMLVQSIEMPTVNSGPNFSLVASGTATSEGLLTRSVDGRFLVLTGYNATPPASSSLASSASATVNRVIGEVNAAGTVNTSTALSDFSDGNNPRSAVSIDGSSFWMGGGAGGLRYATLGSTTSTQISTSLSNIRQVNVFDNQLYISTSSGSTIRIGSVGTGVPTPTGQTITNLPGFPSSTGSPDSYFFADLSPNVPGVDTLYVADDGAGLEKFSLVGGSWTASGLVTASGITGLTAIASGNVLNLYGTTGGSKAAGGGSLYSFVDSTGYDGTISGAANTIATAPTDEAFRGIALAPVSTPEPGTTAMVVVGAGILALRRKRVSK